MGYFSCKKSDKDKKRKGSEINLSYECVGTEEKNQEIIDNVFDFIFEEVLKRRNGKTLIDKYRQE